MTSHNKTTKQVKLSDYPIKIFRYQKIVGPIHHQCSPPANSEVFISRIPEEATEIELFPFLSTAGIIYKLRLMIQEENSSKNRGFAYVMFTTAEAATRAVKQLNSVLFKKSYLSIEKSFDNCRLFVGGVPDRKTKDEVWQELNKCGLKNIVDVIMYRSYTDRALNRGFVFVEFQTHQQAAEARCRFKNLRLWGQKMVIDWSTPLPEVDDDVLDKVKILFLRNLQVSESKEIFHVYLTGLLDNYRLDKVYKFKDYAFIHFKTREEAVEGMELLQKHFAHTKVEVTWAIPQQFAPKRRHMHGKAATGPKDTLSRHRSSSSESFYEEAFFDHFNYHTIETRAEDDAQLFHFEQHNTFSSPCSLLDMPLTNMPLMIPQPPTPEFDEFEVSRRTISDSSDDSGICLPKCPKDETTFRNTIEELLMIPDEYRPIQWLPDVPHEERSFINYNVFQKNNTSPTNGCIQQITSDEDHQINLISSMLNYVLN